MAEGNPYGALECAAEAYAIAEDGVPDTASTDPAESNGVVIVEALLTEVRILMLIDRKADALSILELLIGMLPATSPLQSQLRGRRSGLVALQKGDDDLLAQTERDAKANPNDANAAAMHAFAMIECERHMDAAQVIYRLLDLPASEEPGAPASKLDPFIAGFLWGQLARALSGVYQHQSAVKAADRALALLKDPDERAIVTSIRKWSAQAPPPPPGGAIDTENTDTEVKPEANPKAKQSK